MSGSECLEKKAIVSGSTQEFHWIRTDCFEFPLDFKHRSVNTGNGASNAAKTAASSDTPRLI